MKSVETILKEKNIRLDTFDPVALHGFTQLPNFILRDSQIPAGPKVAYAALLSYAWHNDLCFPGHDRLAEEMGMSRSRVTEFVGSLERFGLVTIERRGQGKTNFYTIHFQVKPQGKVTLPTNFPETSHEKRNMRLDTVDPIALRGFTQIPNFILRDPQFTVGAKIVYAMFLSYAWHDDDCFPGQDRLAEDMGVSRSRVTEFVGELGRAGLVTIERRGQGHTNFYTIHFKVKRLGIKHSDVGGPTSRGRPVYA